MSVRLEIDSSTLALREALHRLVVTGQMSARDLDQMFDEEVVVRLRADRRTLNRLERDGGPVAEAIKAYKKGV